MSASCPTRLGIGLPALDYADLRSWAAAADGAGFEFVSVGDNPAHLKDTFVSLAVLAEVTRRCRIGTAVTSPRYRDPLVLAGAISSVATLAPGRAFLGIATGRARRSAPLAMVRDYITVLRTLWTSGAAVYDGEQLTLDWGAPPVPVLMCASGPDGLRLAGALADGAIVETGVTEDAIRSARGYLAEGAERAGRDPAELEVWWYVKAAIADTYDEALDVALAPLAGSGALALGSAPERRAVPAELHERVRALARRYDMGSHVATGPDDPNRRLLDDPYLRAYLLDRFGLVGTPKNWLTRLTQLRERGIDRVFLASIVPDFPRFISLIGEQVIPELGPR